MLVLHFQHQVFGHFGSQDAHQFTDGAYAGPVIGPLVRHPIAVLVFLRVTEPDRHLVRKSLAAPIAAFATVALKIPDFLEVDQVFLGGFQGFQDFVDQDLFGSAEPVRDLLRNRHFLLVQFEPEVHRLPDHDIVDLLYRKPRLL